VLLGWSPGNEVYAFRVQGGLYRLTVAFGGLL
jgi:hypothetical protein